MHKRKNSDSPVDLATHDYIMAQHPCFNDAAHARVGRIHLPIAPRCNIQCNYCERNTCASMAMRHPGWTAKTLTIGEAVDLVRSIMASRREDPSLVVGVAGPGDPLANNQTFDALRQIHAEYPGVLKCLSTNGLLLEDKLTDIVGVGIRAITVTVNAIDGRIGERIYSWVNYAGTTYYGGDAADLLLEKQLGGLMKAADAGITTKVNTVLIPGINDEQIPKLAMAVKESGAKMMNIMPLIPSAKMASLPSPTCEWLRKVQHECERIIPQFHRCQQCRADIIYLPSP